MSGTTTFRLRRPDQTELAEDMPTADATVARDGDAAGIGRGKRRRGSEDGGRRRRRVEEKRGTRDSEERIGDFEPTSSFATKPSRKMTIQHNPPSTSMWISWTGKKNAAYELCTSNSDRIFQVTL